MPRLSRVTVRDFQSLADVDMKSCTACGIKKPLSQFYAASRNADGRAGSCKDCWCRRVKQWRERQPIQRLREYQRTYRQRHQGEIKRSSAEYRQRTRERRALYNAAYSRRNRQRINERKQLTRSDADRLREAEYRHRHRWQHVLYAQRHRARKLTAATLTEQEWQDALEAWGGLCAYCSRPADSQDHLVPVSQNGTHDRWNVVPACLQCNRRKNAGPPLRPLQLRVPL